MVCQIGSRAETIPIYFAAAMHQSQRMEFQAKQIERASIERVRFQLRNRRLRHSGIENIMERPSNGRQRFLGSENGNGRLLAEVEGTHIVEPHDMVGMLVRKQDRVQPIDLGAQRLRAEVRGSVDQDVPAAVADQDGWAQAVVARVVRGADVTMAADGGHTHARSRSQYCDTQPIAVKRHYLGFLLSSTAWIYRNRSSVREFSSRRCSSSVRLPRVFSRRTFIMSMLWRAKSKSGCGFSFSSPK